ncbi:TPA: PTS glucose transporter subunit IIA [Burkholderia cenocepacia]|nr:PTS glucose transporter subunit IIA [Burkholderia cenocepacia]
MKSPTHDQIVLLSPLTGPIVALADVPDPVFSGGMFGDGIGIDPLAGRLVSTMRTSCRPSRRPARRPRKAAASTRR